MVCGIIYLRIMHVKEETLRLELQEGPRTGLALQQVHCLVFPPFMRGLSYIADLYFAFLFFFSISVIIHSFIFLCGLNAVSKVHGLQ